MRLNIQLFAISKSTTVEESDVNTANNTSDIKVTIKFSANNSVTYFSNKTLSCTLRCYDVNGGTLLHTYNKTKSVSHSKGGSVNTSFTFGDILHDESTGKMYVTASWSINTGTSTLETLTDSKSKTCTQISRASTIEGYEITHYASYDGYYIMLEKHTTDSVYHSFQISYDNGDTFTQRAFNQNTNYTYEVYAIDFPNYKYNYDFPLIFKVETYDDSNKTTLMGASTFALTYTIPSYNLDAVKTGQTDNVITYNTYKLNSTDIIATLSTPTLTFVMVTKYGEDIVSATLNGVSGTINNSLHTVTFSNIAQASNYVLYAVDSRGVTLTKTFSGSAYDSKVKTVPYTPIEIEYELSRPSSTSQSMDIDITASFYDGTNLQNLETPTLTFEYSTDGGNTYTTQALTQTLNSSSIVVSTTFNSSDTAFYKKTFYFRITVTDKLGVSKTIGGYIPSGQPAVYFFKYNNENYTNVYDHLLLDWKPVATEEYVNQGFPSKQDLSNTVGLLNDLNTSDKTDIVNAINELYDELFYKPGDTYEADYLYVGGFLSNSAKGIYFTIFLPKKFGNDIDTATIDNCDFYIRKSNGGYLENGATPSSFNTIDFRDFSDNRLTIICTKSSAYSSATNNTPVGIELRNLKVTFSQNNNQ